MQTTALASIINTQTILEARLAYQIDANLPAECRLADLTGIKTATASFPYFAAATVTKPGSETTDVTTNSDITPTNVTLAVVRRTVKIEPSDLGWASSVEDLSVRLGQLIGKARAKQVDTDILAVMTTTWTSSVGATNVTALKVSDILSGLLTLEVNEANYNLILALHPKQWNTLRDDFILANTTNSQSNATDRSPQGVQVLTTGFMQLPFLGCRIISTPRVGTGTDTNAEYLGILGNFSDAIGYTVKNVAADLGLPEIELWRYPEEGTTRFVHNYYDKAGVVRASGLVLVKSQTY